MEPRKKCSDVYVDNRNCQMEKSNPAFKLFLGVREKFQSFLKTQLKFSMESEPKRDNAYSLPPENKNSFSDLNLRLEKQIEAWKKNPAWVDEPPEIKVSVPKGSFCKLNVKAKVGLPPGAIYNIVIDPENKRVFKNIKEVISRKVLVDEGSRQLVEVEQAALWRFLWWSGTISVHVLVDQNRKDHSVSFKQGKMGFMKRFEGHWKVDPVFVDEQLCCPQKPETWMDYDSCTEGKGRIGSIVKLEQIIQPALLPPPPISWYLRGITSRTTEMLINDLLAEAARIRRDFNSNQELDLSNDLANGTPENSIGDIKERWRQRRSKHRQRRDLVRQD